MKSKFKLDDVFSLKYARDDVPLKIIEIHYKEYLEPTYILKPIKYNGNNIFLGEEALEKLYYQHKKNNA